MATMARMTTTSSAEAMMTAAVGLSPKIVVRSMVIVRGSAESLSPLLVVVELSRRVSVLELLLVAAAPGSLGLAADESLDVLGGAVTVPLAEPDGPETDPLAEPDGVETEPLADPLGLLLVCAMAPPTSPKVTRAMSRRTA